MNTALRIQEQRLKDLKDLEDQVRARNNGDGAKNGKSHPSVTNPIAPCVTVKNTLCNNSTPANNVTQDIQGNTGIQDIQGDSGLSIGDPSCPTPEYLRQTDHEDSPREKERQRRLGRTEWFRKYNGLSSLREAQRDPDGLSRRMAYL